MLVAWAVPLAFFVFSLACWDQFGVTIDEPETLRASRRNVNAVRTLQFDTHEHELPYFHFVFDLAGGLFIKAIRNLRPAIDAYDGLHLFRAILSSLSLA